MSLAISADVVRELAPGGTLRVAINFGNSVLAQRGPGGEARGISVDLARELGRQLGVETKLVSFDAAGKVVEAMRRGEWDVAFLAIDPQRADELLFSPPYLLITGAFMVAAESTLQSVAEVDAPGVRVAIGAGSAYDLYLTRTLKHARIERQPTALEAFDMFMRQKLEVAAGIRQVVERHALQHPGLRVLQGSFMEIQQAMCTPMPRTAAARFLTEFIDTLKVNGWVGETLSRNDQTDATVAPHTSSST